MTPATTLESAIVDAKGIDFVRDYLARRSERTPAGCLVWTLRRNPKGYGKANFWLVDRVVTIRPHRLAFLLHHGYLTPGLTIDHRCRNTACIEPTHLDECTAIENIQRAPNRNLAKTHCHRGHPLVAENLIASMLPSRSCRACSRERAMRRREAHNQSPQN